MEVHRADAGLQAWRPFPAGSGEEAEEYGILAVRLHFLPGSSDGDRVGVYVLRNNRNYSGAMDFSGKLFYNSRAIYKSEKESRREGGILVIRTLMIEDDTLLAGALRLLLEENGHQVQAVCTYRETMMQDFSSYDFFCVDIHLPDGNGIDICREIRRAGRQPILVLTAYEDEDYAVRAFEAGADDYVIKRFAAESWSRA